MFGGLFVNSLLSIHQGQNNARLLSPRLWGRAINSGLAADGAGGGWFHGDDFRLFGKTTAVATNVGRYGSEAQYYSYEDTGGTIAQLATERTGVVRISTDNTDNDEMWLQPGDAASVSSVISDSAGADKLVVFETRFRLQDIVSNRFFGLTEEGTAVADTITDAGAMVDKDWIGFFALEAAPTTLKFGYKKSGQTAQTIISNLQTLAASTWYKVGFVYDPKAPNSKRIRIYVDNVENSTYVTAASIAAATFPNGEELQPLFGHKNASGVITSTDLDWWALYCGD